MHINQTEYLQFKQPFWVLANENYYKHSVMKNGIDHFYCFVADGEKENEIIVPDGCVDIVFCCDTDYPYMQVAGTVTNATQGNRKKGTRFFGVRLFPGYYQELAGVSFRELQDNSIPFDDIVPDASGIEKIITCDDFVKQVEVFMDAFLKGEFGKTVCRKESPLFDEIMNEIMMSGGNITVWELANRTYYSQRRINGVFSENMGISLKQFCNIARFQNALGYMNDQNYEEVCLVELALAMGYYDQAHMSKEFKKYSLNTPKKYLDKVKKVDYGKLINLV